MDESSFDNLRFNAISVSNAMNESRNLIREQSERNDRNMSSYKNVMNESSFDRVNNAIMYYFGVSALLFALREAAHVEFDSGKSYLDTLKFMSDIDCIKKEFPDTYKKYFNKFQIRLNGILFAIIDPPKVPYDFRESNIVLCISSCIKEEIEYLTELLNPETETQEPPQKFEKLKPIEKLLIIDYLKIDSLKRCQLGQKPGVFFLSRLLDIKMDSIKKPLLKLDDYTTNELTKAQAANIYPTLEKIKSFFDKSELKGISKIIEIRINEIKRILGKD